MTISVTIPAYNEEKYIGDCLRSIKERTPENLLEIIVVNNASTDRTAEVAAAIPGVRVVEEKQKGLTKARQRGYLESKGDLIACIDADTRVPQGWFEILNREFARDPNLVCLSGPFRYYDLPERQGRVVRLWNWCAEHVSSMSGKVVQGGNFIVKRSALEKIGGFDTKIEFYGEDTNIARRLAEVGKVKFTRHLFMNTSARRLHSEGMVKTGSTYLTNFLSELFLKKPVTKKYRDIR